MMKCELIFFVMSIILCLLSSLSFFASDSLALSPSFSIQSDIDKEKDWIFRNQNQQTTSVETHSGYLVDVLNSENPSQCKTSSPDIKETSVISDGKTLNGTIWLSDHFKIPLNNYLNKYRENVAIYRINIGNVTLHDFINTTLSNIKEKTANFQIINSSVVTLQYNIPTSIFTYSYIDSFYHSNMMAMIWLIKYGSNGYIISYGAQADEFSRYRESVKNMFDSFRVTNESVYQDPHYKIKLQYPLDWDKHKDLNDNNFQSILKSTYEGSAGFSPPDNNSAVLLQIENLPNSNISLNNYVNSYTNNLKQKNITNFDIADINIKNIGNNITANRVMYTYNFAETKFSVMDFIFLNNQKLYRLSFSAPIPYYDKYLPAFQKMISTLDLNYDNQSLAKNSTIPYENFGFKILYPSKWEVQHPSNATITDFTHTNMNISDFNVYNDYNNKLFGKHQDTVAFVRPITKNTGNSWEQLRFNMVIEPDSIYRYSENYLLRLEWDGKKQNWTSSLYERPVTS